MLHQGCRRGENIKRGKQRGREDWFPQWGRDDEKVRWLPQLAHWLQCFNNNMMAKTGQCISTKDRYVHLFIVYVLSKIRFIIEHTYLYNYYFKILPQEHRAAAGRLHEVWADPHRHGVHALRRSQNISAGQVNTSLYTFKYRPRHCYRVRAILFAKYPYK